jgi:hypothetical protein
MRRNFIAPLLLLSVYIFPLYVILPGGINQRFSQTLLCTTFLLLVAGALGYLSLRYFRPLSLAGEAANDEEFRASDVLLLLLPLNPVVQYILLNRDILHWWDNLAIIAIFGFASSITILIIPQLLRKWVSRSIAVFLGLSLTFTMINMAALARYFSWHKSGEFSIQVGMLLLVFFVGLVIYRKDRQALNIAIVCYFVGTIAVTFSGSATESEASVEPNKENLVIESSETKRLASGKEILHRPDIFLLTYDSYVENKTMLQYGIDNSAQESYLESKGFKLYPGTYSIARASVPSMGGVLGSGNPKQAVAGNSPVLKLLQQAGYRTHGVFTRGYFFQGVDIGYDYGFPPPAASFLVVIRAVAEGQFRHNVQFQDISFDQFVDQKRSIMNSQSDHPSFLYTHTGPGHSQNSGSCLADEVARFESKLSDSNVEMREDVETILRSSPEAIIIVNGDHGPHLTKNCLGSMEGDYALNEITPLDLQDRFGSFLAIRWPDQVPAFDENIMILQDIFPTILAFLYGDPEFLALRIPRTLARDAEGGIKGVTVNNGYIVGGAYDGSLLFDSTKRPEK